LLGFQSAWTDPGTGKDLMGARWYAPSEGDFTSADTVQVDPDPDPAAASPFAYAADNPLGYTDPTGHMISIGSPETNSDYLAETTYANVYVGTVQRVGATAARAAATTAYTSTEKLVKKIVNPKPRPAKKKTTALQPRDKPSSSVVQISPHVYVAANLPQAHALQTAWQRISDEYSSGDEYSNWMRLCILYRNLCSGAMREDFTPTEFPTPAGNVQQAFGADVKIVFGGNGTTKGYYFPLLGSSATLGRRMIKAGEVKYAGYETHHIVAEKDPDGAPARQVLSNFGIDINNPENGVFLPATSATQNPTGSVVHRGPTLTDDYIEYVNAQMSQASTREEALEVLQAIKDNLIAGNMPWTEDGGEEAAAPPGELW
jgi:RHS repeat-associated protein